MISRLDDSVETYTMPYKMRSAEIQQAVEELCYELGFNAPYGILTGEHVSKQGKKYKSVTFGRPRSLDATVMIFNNRYMLVKTSSDGDRTFTSVNELLEYVRTL